MTVMRAEISAYLSALTSMDAPIETIGPAVHAWLKSRKISEDEIHKILSDLSGYKEMPREEASRGIQPPVNPTG